MDLGTKDSGTRGYPTLILYTIFYVLLLGTSITTTDPQSLSPDVYNSLMKKPYKHSAIKEGTAEPFKNVSESPKFMCTLYCTSMLYHYCMIQGFAEFWLICIFVTMATLNSLKAPLFCIIRHPG